jgi:hypothetical protein
MTSSNKQQLFNVRSELSSKFGTSRLKYLNMDKVGRARLIRDIQDVYPLVSYERIQDLVKQAYGI